MFSPNAVGIGFNPYKVLSRIEGPKEESFYSANDCEMRRFFVCGDWIPPLQSIDYILVR